MAAAAAAFATLAAVPAAHAGTYTLFSCRLPDGSAAGTWGWTSAGAGKWHGEPNTCETGGSMDAVFQSAYAHDTGDYSEWRFTVPSGVNVVRFRGNRAATLGPADAFARPAYSMKRDTNALEYCASGWACELGDINTPSAASNAFDHTGFAASSLSFGVECTGGTSATCPAGDTRARLFRAEITLRDETDPSVSSVSGQLAQAGTHSGVETVTFATTDQGSGAYRGIVLVDGTPVRRVPIDQNDAACRDAYPGDADPYQFVAGVPCKLSTSASVSWDTKTVADGAHTLEVRVEDAAGNEATVFGPSSVTVENVPAPVNTSAPTIAGTPQEGRTLVADRGTWDARGGEEPSYAYRWLRCDAAGDACSAVAGRTGLSYDVTSADVGRTLRFEVTAANREGSAAARSAATARILDASGQLPPCAGAPTAPTDPCGDFDGDGTPNAADPDDDNDGVADGDDRYPFDAGHAAGPQQGGAAAAVLHTPDNGRNASNHARITIAGARTRRVPFGRRIATVAHLRDENGRPIAGARVVVLERMDVPGAAWVPARSPLVTDRNGRMRWVIPAKFGRTIRYAYKASMRNADFQSVQDLRLRVLSRSTLVPSRRSARNGQAVTFKGRLLSRPVPRGGVLIDLQARVRSGWQTFKTVRAGRSGRWRTRYRFRSTRGTHTYSFRARVRQDSGYPYALSTTRRVSIRVRG